MGVAEDLRGKVLQGLKRLQVAGFSRLDGGAAINGAAINGAAMQDPVTLNGLSLLTSLLGIPGITPAITPGTTSGWTKYKRYQPNGITNFTMTGFPQIPGASLVIIWKATSDHASAAWQLALGFNGDAAAHYDTAAPAFNASGLTQAGVGALGNTAFVAGWVGDTNDIGGAGIMIVPAYSSTLAHLCVGVFYRKDVSVSAVGIAGGMYNQTTAITELDWGVQSNNANFKNADFTLYIV